MSEANALAEVNNGRGVAPQSESMLPLIQQAIAGGIDPAKLEKMLDLHERWLQARAAETFGNAVADFQAEMPAIEKKRAVKVQGVVRSMFANYEDIMHAARPLLTKHGISIGYNTDDLVVDGIRFIEATIRIRVGSYFEDKKFRCPIPMELSASQPQKWGAALAFARRYAICAALDIVTCDESDDDGESVVSTISALQFLELERIGRTRTFHFARFLEWIAAPSLEMIPFAKFEQAKKQLLSFPVKPVTKPVDGDPEP